MLFGLVFWCVIGLPFLVSYWVRDSEVRTRLYFVFMRAGIPLAMPAHALFLTEDSQERREQKREGQDQRGSHCALRVMRSITLRA